MHTHLSFATSLARKAGVIIRRNFSLGMRKKWKGNTSPVTVTDLTVEKMVRNAVHKKFPDHGFIGEEYGRTKEMEFMWTCDPVDGTIPFSHGIPTCVFMLALVHHGRPVLSVIYDPFQKRMFTSVQGKGAFLNNKRIHVSKQQTLKKAVYGVFFWKEAPYQLEQVYLSLNNQFGIDGAVGSIGYVDALLASGEFSVVVFAGNCPWDSAAPDILVNEAGGMFTDLYGKIIDYRKPVRGHIATNGILHYKILKIVQSTLK